MGLTGASRKWFIPGLDLNPPFGLNEHLPSAAGQLVPSEGPAAGLTLMYLQYESRIIGLVLVLGLALRLLGIVEWTVRKKLQEHQETLKGLYLGQAGQETQCKAAAQGVTGNQPGDRTTGRPVDSTHPSPDSSAKEADRTLGAAT